MRERGALVVSERDRNGKKSRSWWLKLLVEFYSKQHLGSRSRTRGGKPEPNYRFVRPVREREAFMALERRVEK